MLSICYLQDEDACTAYLHGVALFFHMRDLTRFDEYGLATYLEAEYNSCALSLSAPRASDSKAVVFGINAREETSLSRHAPVDARVSILCASTCTAVPLNHCHSENMCRCCNVSCDLRTYSVACFLDYCYVNSVSSAHQCWFTRLPGEDNFGLVIAGLRV